MSTTEVTESILAKLSQIENRYCEINEQIADPAVATDPARLVALSKEQGKLKSLVSRFRQYKQATAEMEDARQMLEDESTDQELKDLAREEIERLEARSEALFEDMLNTFVMADEMSVGSIIMEIRAGTGGDEAALFAGDLYNMYTRYADSRRWKVEQLDFSPSEMGGYREVILSIKGEGAWAELGYEGGGHRVQRVPETESQGRIHTSAATVAVLPEPEEIDIQIDPNDVVEHVSRAGGPGGQNVNKVSSAIKLEHTPTGICVSMRDEKSQHKNRAKAWRILRTRIYEHFEGQKRAERDSKRKTMIGSGDRSQKIRTYNYPQNRVTDHRINLSLYNLDRVMAGDLAEVVAALKEHDKQERLKNL